MGFGVAVVVGSYYLIKYETSYNQIPKMNLATCTLTSNVTTEINLASLSCGAVMYIFNVSYPDPTQSNSILHSIVISAVNPNPPNFTCIISSTNKYYVKLLNDSPSNGNLVLGAICIAVGLGLFIIFLFISCVNQRLKIEDKRHWISYFVGGFWLGGCIASLVFLGMVVNYWVGYDSDNCEVIGQQFSVKAVAGRKSGCTRSYTVNEFVKILSTGSIATYTITENSVFALGMDISLHRVGETYSCFYRGSDAIFSRDLYYPWIIPAGCCLLFSIIFLIYPRCRNYCEFINRDEYETINENFSDKKYLY